MQHTVVNPTHLPLKDLMKPDIIKECKKTRNLKNSTREELEGVVGERDILGAQLIRRNEVAVNQGSACCLGFNVAA